MDTIEIRSWSKWRNSDGTRNSCREVFPVSRIINVSISDSKFYDQLSSLSLTINLGYRHSEYQYFMLSEENATKAFDTIVKAIQGYKEEKFVVN